MYYYASLFIAFLWLYPSQVYCQVFMGGDVKVEREPLNTTNCHVEIDIYYTAEDTSFNGHSIPVSVNTGFQGQVNWVQKTLLSKNLMQFKYEFSSSISIGPYLQVIVDTLFVVEDIKNYSGTSNLFRLENSIHNSIGAAVTNQDIANFENNQDAYYFDQDGVLHYPFDVSESDGNQVDVGFNNSLTFENEFYDLPIASSSIYVDNNTKEFIWDRPAAPGKYFFGFSLVEYNPGEIILGTKNRFQFIEIKETDIIVDIEESISDVFKIDLSPNPTASTLHLQLQYPHAAQGKLLIENLAGQTLHTEDLNLSPTLQSWQVDVADWPSGVYVVRLLAGAEQVVRKFVVE